MRARVLIGWLAGALFLAAATLAHVAAADPTRDAVRALLARDGVPELQRPVFADYRRTLEGFYAARDYLPAWFTGGRAQPEAAVALDELAAAPAHGLVAVDYDVDGLRREAEAIAGGDRSAQRLARADVALSLTLLRYLSDLHGGRVPPRTAGFLLASGNSGFDPGAVLAGALGEHRLREAIAAVAPSFVVYGRLQAALARYRELANRPLPALPPLPRGTTRIEPGQSYAGAAALATRLTLLGDLSPTAAPVSAGVYDGALVDAVRVFQRRHGLAQDGVVGRNTLAQLAVPLVQRVRQIELAMERLRWVPRLPAGPVIAVNIPSYTLRAFDGVAAESTPALTMEVIVGRATAALQTPVFIGEMRSIEFSPYWNVPPSILEKELMPILARDPDYLAREDMEIVGPDRDAPPRTRIDAAALAALRDGTARLRQRPGPKNALGGIKFVLPNTMSVYLHGTPQRELFQRTRRDFSHGCIRVADPLALARFVLRDRPEWTVERMEGATTAQQLKSVPLPRPVPVVIFYTTVTIDADGRPQFLADVYGYDGKLDAALARRAASAAARTQPAPR